MQSTEAPDVAAVSVVAAAPVTLDVALEDDADLEMVVLLAA